MLIIIIIRTAILVTCALLIIGEPAAFIWLIRFNARYERRHKELEADIDALKSRVKALEVHQK